MLIMKICLFRITNQNKTKQKQRKFKVCYLNKKKRKEKQTLIILHHLNEINEYDVKPMHLILEFGFPSQVHIYLLLQKKPLLCTENQHENTCDYLFNGLRFYLF